jgi:hypothetical protein
MRSRACPLKRPHALINKGMPVRREDSTPRKLLLVKLAASTLLFTAACMQERSYNSENKNAGEDASVPTASSSETYATTASATGSHDDTSQGSTLMVDGGNSDVKTSDDNSTDVESSDDDSTDIATSGSTDIATSGSTDIATSEDHGSDVDTGSDHVSSTDGESEEPALVSVVVVLDASSLSSMDERATLNVLCQYGAEEPVTCTNRASIDIEDSTVARLDDAGELEPLTNGTTAIVASVEGLSSEPATLVVDVGPICKTLHVDGAATGAAGTSVQWAVTCDFDDGTKDVDVSEIVVWESDAPTVAPVSESGSITATEVGSVTITASLSNPDRSTTASSRTFTVTNGTLVAISITPGDGVSIPDGKTSTLSAECEYTDVTSECTSSVSWVSSSPLVATVDSSGVATAKGAGTSSVSAKLGEVSSNELTVTVTAPVLTSIVLNPNSAVTLEVNTDRQLTATCVMSNATSSNCTSQVTWSSSEPTVALASDGGRIAALTDGTSLIAAARDGVVSSAVTATIVPPNGCEDAIDFPDAVMLQNVRDLTGKAAGSIYYEDVKSITTFEHSQVNGFLEFLDGIQCFTSLRSLTVQRAWLEDLSPIVGLIHLERLDVAFTSVFSLPDLSLLTKLSEIDLANTAITDLFSLVVAEHFGEGDTVNVTGSALDCTADWTLEQIAELEARGVAVAHACQ